MLELRVYKATGAVITGSIKMVSNSLIGSSI